MYTVSYSLLAVLSWLRYDVSTLYRSSVIVVLYNGLNGNDRKLSLHLGIKYEALILLKGGRQTEVQCLGRPYQCTAWVGWLIREIETIMKDGYVCTLVQYSGSLTCSALYSINYQHRTLITLTAPQAATGCMYGVNSCY